MDRGIEWKVSPRWIPSRMERRGPYMVRSGCWRVTPCCAAVLYLWPPRFAFESHPRRFDPIISPRAIPISVIIRLATGAHGEVELMARQPPDQNRDQPRDVLSRLRYRLRERLLHARLYTAMMRREKRERSVHGTMSFRVHTLEWPGDSLDHFHCTDEYTACHADVSCLRYEEGDSRREIYQGTIPVRGAIAFEAWSYFYPDRVNWIFWREGSERRLRQTQRRQFAKSFSLTFHPSISSPWARSISFLHSMTLGTMEMSRRLRDETSSPCLASFRRQVGSFYSRFSRNCTHQVSAERSINALNANKSNLWPARGITSICATPRTGKIVQNNSQCVSPVAITLWHITRN